MDWDSRDINRDVGLGPGCQEGFTGQGVLLFYFLSLFFDILLSVDSVLPYFSINGTNEMLIYFPAFSKSTSK